MRRPLPSRRGAGAAALLSTWLAFQGGPSAATPAAAPAAAAAPSSAPAAPDISTVIPAAVNPPAGAPAAPPASALAPSADAGEDIRDIRGPKVILSPWVVAAAVGAVLLLALVVYGAWRWLRHRRRPRALLPFELALQRLAEIRVLMQPETAREFSIAVSDVVRGYVEVGFGIVATHRTTEEFLHDLLESSNHSLARHRALLAEFLEQCDLVKFAGVSLTAQTMESLHGAARVFVLETARPEEPPSRAAPPAGGIEEARDSLPST